MPILSPSTFEQSWLPACVQDLTVALQAYVGSNHPGGLKWSPTGISIEQARAQLAAAGTGTSTSVATATAVRPKAAGGPPAAPPPPPPGLLLQERPAKGPAASAAGTSAGGGAMQDLFKDLSKVYPMYALLRLHAFSGVEYMVVMSCVVAVALARVAQTAMC